LEEVQPLFNVPASVVFGKHSHYTRKPFAAEVLSGVLPRKNASLAEATEALLVRETNLHLIHQGDRSFWSEDPKAQMAGTSPYASKFFQGATIVPRTAWFVQIQFDRDLGFSPSTPYVKTDQRATDQAKEAYADLTMEGNIEKEFLYATLLSTDLLPFGFLQYRSVVLPIKPSNDPSSDTFLMVDLEMARKEGYSHLAKWLEVCEKEWKERRKEKAGKMTIYERLDHVHGLTQQHYRSRFKVVYPTSATNLCSAVVPNERINIRLGAQSINLRRYVVESKLYYYETENEKEAHFLSAFLNAPFVDEKIKPMQSRGLWGPRDIHKKIWELPIPAFDQSKSSHIELSQLGIHCAKKVSEILPSLDTVQITPGRIGRLRSEVRDRLRTELQQIDVVVGKIMRKQESSALV